MVNINTNIIYLKGVTLIRREVFLCKISNAMHVYKKEILK